MESQKASTPKVANVMPKISKKLDNAGPRGFDSLPPRKLARHSGKLDLKNDKLSAAATHNTHVCFEGLAVLKQKRPLPNQIRPAREWAVRVWGARMGSARMGSASSKAV